MGALPSQGSEHNMYNKFMWEAEEESRLAWKEGADEDSLGLVTTIFQNTFHGQDALLANDVLVTVGPSCKSRRQCAHYKENVF